VRRRVRAEGVLAYLGHLELHHQPPVGGYDLAAILPGDRVADAYRFEPGRVRAGGQAAVDDVPLEQLTHRLQAKGSRLSRILEEVRLKKPFARIDVLLRPETAEPGPPGARPVPGNTVEHVQHRPGGQVRTPVARPVQPRPFGVGRRQTGLPRERGTG